MNLRNTYQILCSDNSTFTKIDHVSSHKENISKFHKVLILQITLWSHYNKVKNYQQKKKIFFGEIKFSINQLLCFENILDERRTRNQNYRISFKIMKTLPSKFC